MTRSRPHLSGLMGLLAAVGVVLSGCLTPDVSEFADDETPADVVIPPLEPDDFFDTTTEEQLLWAEASDIVRGLSLDEKVAALFVIFHPGTEVETFEDFFDRLPVSGFLLLRSNLPGPHPDDQEFVTSLAGISELPVLLAVDQEGPPVARIRADGLPGHKELGQGDPRDTREVFAERNQLVADLGANVNFGTVADISPGPSSYIDNRAFGSDPKKVTAHVFHAVNGRVPGVAQTLKHFPGHGLTAEDSHVVIPRVEIEFDDWLDRHGQPFQAGIGQGVDMVMMSHIVVSNLDPNPASLSPFWVSFLRDQWGFEGVIVTDDVAMLQASGEEEFRDPVENVIRALNAGVDLIVHSDFGPPDQTSSRYDELIPAVIDRVRAGDVTVNTIDQALTRVISLRLVLGRVSGGF